MAQTTAPVLCQSQLAATVNDHSNTQANATLLPLDNSRSGQGVAVGGLPPAPLGSRRLRRSSLGQRHLLLPTGDNQRHLDAQIHPATLSVACAKIL